MRHALDRRSPFGLAALGPFPVVSVALVAAAAAFAVYALGGRAASDPQPARAAPAAAPKAPAESLHGPAPTAREFARTLTGLANQFAAGQARLDQVDCVQGSRGHYMCSFALLQPTKPAECHLIQAIWTPMALDSFEVTLSGLASRCGSVREAVRSLQ